MVSLRLVTPGFFDAMQIPLRLGRDVRAGDRFDPATPLVEGVPVPSVAIVSEAFVRDYLPGGKPLGQRFRLAFSRPPSSASSATSACAGSNATASRRSICRRRPCRTDR